MKPKVENDQSKTKENESTPQDDRPSKEGKRTSMLVRTALKAGGFQPPQCW